MIAYGELECHTIVKEITVAVELSIKEVNSRNVHACAADASSYCNYQTYDVASQMIVSSVAISSGTDLTFTGALFPSEDCEGVFLDMVSDSCTVNSATEIVAKFDSGVPTSSTEVTPELKFIGSDGSHYALADELAVV